MDKEKCLHWITSSIAKQEKLLKRPISKTRRMSAYGSLATLTKMKQNIDNGKFDGRGETHDNSN
ncbi:hypothetical protein G3A_06300 [Bacillus sp. 17376]|uniref:Uncharacterized protein n=1 Tax=Mesobacillus boroniphilus JCM 21738 TaxID=1294265 RepID=W4RSQ8_9BACI|nr:hypothetical protein [Mesobacillus boroniphilus]ESU33434.1 hypothetical protein G3A_06300 [Bacillus sp. 17376]GAE47346.1 hypothetical protein JCM21738_4318 [Mesobacillus boroniphilus JCM 21738]